MKPATPALRCAIYTRVSSDHGLDQEFSSLDNQREAAEAYIKSQAHEGWRCQPGRYDDGGFSGGSLDRPGLQRLLADVRERRFDIIVVYKVDRLTRSLADFAKLVELFDAHGVSFVSVTQAFNTTTSMGRLTLNVLLSFAQFEREVTGERIRDKIAASKKKGLWMGGVVPLGYRVEARKLLIEPQEAELVRAIFERYLEVGSVPALQRALRADGIVSRRRTLSSGREIGGTPFTNGPLSHLLRNRVYLGEINHKGISHPGEHQPIISCELFSAVQARLATNQLGKRGPCSRSEALLLRKLFDDRGNRMTPVVGRKGPVRYRYYASHATTQGRHSDAGSVPRVPAHDIETKVVAELKRALGGEHDVADDRELIASRLDRAILSTASIELHVRRTESDVEPISMPWNAPRHRQRRAIVEPHEKTGAEYIRSTERARLLSGIVKARDWLRRLVSGEATALIDIAEGEGLSERSARMTLSLAFLPPVVIQTAIEGALPRGQTVSRLVEPDLAWQRRSPPR
jgi:site-specific DNA recombinase